MQTDKTEAISITNTTKSDLSVALWLFEQAMALQNRNSYKVWQSIDQANLERDIEKGLQYKFIKDKDILCIFSIQYNDPFIWRERDRNDAIYLHRIVVNPNFKGQKMFEKVLNWSVVFTKQNDKKFIRMDTWADNYQLIEYYKSFGFRFIKNYKTEDTVKLPIQNRNLNVALLELNID